MSSEGLTNIVLQWYVYVSSSTCSHKTNFICKVRTYWGIWDILVLWLGCLLVTSLLRFSGHRPRTRWWDYFPLTWSAWGCLRMPLKELDGRIERSGWMTTSRVKDFGLFVMFYYEHMCLYVCVCERVCVKVGRCKFVSWNGGVIFRWKLNSINYFSIVVALSIPRDKQRELLKLHSIRVLFGGICRCVLGRRKQNPCTPQDFTIKGRNTMQ